MIDENLKAGNVINMYLDTPIYKYIPFKYLKLMIQNSSLYFGSVSSWEDVYENWFLKEYLQPIITQYFIDNKSEIWLLFLIAHSKR